MCGLSETNETKPDIMCMVETKVNVDTELGCLNELDYNLWRCDRTGRRGGEIW